MKLNILLNAGLKLINSRLQIYFFLVQQHHFIPQNRFYSLPFSLYKAYPENNATFLLPQNLWQTQ